MTSFARFIATSSALIVMFFAAAVSGTGVVRAQGNERVQQAIRLFEDARESIARGDIAQACRQFDESERLDPQLGTKMHLADCYERQGKLASAWLHFRAAEMLAAERVAAGAVEPREKIARLRAAKLQGRLPTFRVVISVPQADLVVTLDGRTIPPRSLATTMPVDPGDHVLQVSAPGRSSWQRSFAIAEQKHQELQVPELLPKLVLEAPPPSPAVAQPTVTGTADVAAGPPFDALRIVAYALAGVGLIAGGTGIALGVATNSTISKRDALCPDDVCRDREEFERVEKLTQDARGTATPATLLMVGGGLAFAVGVTWLMLRPKSSDTQLSLMPSLSPYAAGVTLHGRGL